jgi:hypothetical protein
MHLQESVTSPFPVQDRCQASILRFPQEDISFQFTPSQVQDAMPAPIIQARHRPAKHTPVIEQEHLPQENPDSSVIFFTLVIASIERHK